MYYLCEDLLSTSFQSSTTSFYEMLVDYHLFATLCKEPKVNGDLARPLSANISGASGSVLKLDDLNIWKDDVLVAKVMVMDC